MATASSNVSTGAQPMSGKVREMIHSMKEIVGNDFSDHETYLALKENNMDPNASTSKLLDQGSWIEVKRKKRKNVPQSLGYRRNPEDSGNPTRVQSVSDRSNVRHGGGYIRTGNAGKNRESDVRAVKDGESSFRAGIVGTIGNEQGAAGGSTATSDIPTLPGANGYTQNSSVPSDCQPGLTKDAKEREQNSRNKSKVNIPEVIGTPRKSAFAPSELAPNDACDDIEAQASTSASPPATISLRPPVIRPPSPTPLGGVSSDPSASALTLGDPSNPHPEPEPQGVSPFHIWTAIYAAGPIEISKFDTTGVIQECSLCNQEEKIIKGDDMLYPYYVLPRVGQTILLLPDIFFIIRHDAAYIKIVNAFEPNNPLTTFARELFEAWDQRTDERRFDLHVMEHTFQHTVGLLENKVNCVRDRKFLNASTITPASDTVSSTSRRIWKFLCVALYRPVVVWLKMDKIQDLNHMTELRDLIGESEKIKGAALKCSYLFKSEDRKSCYLPYLISKCDDMAMDMSCSLLRYEKKRSIRTSIKKTIASVCCSVGTFLGVLATASVGLDKKNAEEAQQTLWYMGWSAIGVAVFGGICSFFF